MNDGWGDIRAFGRSRKQMPMGWGSINNAPEFGHMLSNAGRRLGQVHWKRMGIGLGATAAIGGGAYEYMDYRRSHPSSGRRSGFYDGT